MGLYGIQVDAVANDTNATRFWQLAIHHCRRADQAEEACMYRAAQQRCLEWYTCQYNPANASVMLHVTWHATCTKMYLGKAQGYIAHCVLSTA